MQRKRPDEECERLRELDGTTLQQQCARFVREREVEIAKARPAIPKTLNDRAGDIWEPLLVIADLAGGEWPELARSAAVALSGSAQETSSPVSLLFADIKVVFEVTRAERLFSREIVEVLNHAADRPWRELRRGKPLTEMWLAMQLRPYGIRPRTMWIGSEAAKGYEREDFEEVFSRYLPACAGMTNDQRPMSKEVTSSNQMIKADEESKATENTEPIAREEKMQMQLAVLLQNLMVATRKKPIEGREAEVRNTGTTTSEFDGVWDQVFRVETRSKHFFAAIFAENTPRQNRVFRNRTFRSGPCLFPS